MPKRTALLLVLILVSVSILTFLDTSPRGEYTTQLYTNDGTVVAGGPVDLSSGKGMDISYYFKIGRDVPTSDASLDISTFNVEEGMALKEPYVDVGLDGNKEWMYKGVGYGLFGEQHHFSDDKVQTSISYGSGGGSDSTNSILLPKDSEILNASIGIRGRFQSPSAIPISSYQIERDPSTFSIDGYAMEHGDIDQDGDQDVVVSDTRNSRIVWLENPNSTSGEWTLHVIYSGYYVQSCYSLDVGDIDGDGDLDVAASSYSRGYVMWFRNDNDANTWIRFRFYTSFRYAGRVRIADIDQDGNPDIVVSTWYYYHYYNYGRWIYWFEAPDNPATNYSTSSGGSSSYWRYHSISSNPTYYYYTYAAMDVGDFNGDDYPDIAVAVYPRYSWYNVNRVYRFINPKSATGSWSSMIIDNSAQQVHSLAVEDMDGDDDDDIITATYGGSTIKYYRNSNNGSSWSENTLMSFTNPRFILAEDLNDDNRTDIVVGGGSGVYEFAVLYQGSSDTSYTKYTITQAIINPFAFTPLDSDLDGDLDFMVAGTSGSQLVLINTTSKTTPSHQVIWLEDGGVKDIRGLDQADMDGDGDLDVVFCAYGTGWIGWMENDGTPFNGAGPLHRIGSIGNPIEIMVADVNGDDKNDIVALSSGGVAYWWENIGNSLTTWPGYLIASGIPNAYSMFAGDFTGDGKADMVTSSARGYSGGEIRLYKCPSNPRTTFSMNRIASSISYLKRIWADDMDLDGDLDVLAVYGSYGSGSVVYYRNPLEIRDPMSGAWQAVSVGGGMYYPEDVRSWDITDDGYPDVVTTGSYYYSKVRWFQSPYGDQVPSWTGRVLYNGAYNWRLSVGDIGNDGYADIILNRGSYSSPSSVYWFEEGVDYTQSWNSRSLGSYSGTWALDIVDLEGDGVQEILSTSKSRDEIRAYRLDATFPSNIGLDVGADSSSADWSKQGVLKGVTRVDIRNALQFIIDNEPSSISVLTDTWGTEILKIPFELISGSSGRVQMEGINILYNATVVIDQNGEGTSLSKIIDRLVPDYTDEQNPKIRIYVGVGADGPGMAYISNLKVEYNAIPRRTHLNFPELRLKEDESKIFDFQLKDYFQDDYTAPEDLSIDVRLSGPRANMVRAEVVGGKLAVDATISPNFYTRLSEPYDIYIEFIVTDDGGPNGIPERTLVTRKVPLIVEPVNDAPVLTGEQLPPLYGLEGSTVEIVNLKDYNLFYDADGDTIQYFIWIPETEDIPNYNESAGLKVRKVGGTRIEVSLNEFSDWTGTFPLKVYGTDGKVGLDLYKTPRVETTVTINNTNDPPSWTDIPPSYALEDTPSQRLVELSKYVRDIDTDKRDLTITIEDWTNGTFISPRLETLSNGQVYIGTDPRIENWNGWTTVTVTVSDGEFSDTTELDIIVEPVNDLPSIKILEPTENGREEPGPFSVVGEATDVEGIEWVEVLFLGQWYRATGKTTWGITLEAPQYKEMQERVPIQVRAFDGEEYAYSYVNITILKWIPPTNLDSDGDGYDDINDDFPFDPSEHKDSDRDGVGDNEDMFPYEAAWQKDSDHDGVADKADTNINDPMLWNDNDGDGYNDETGPPTRRVSTSAEEEKSWFWPIFFFVLAALGLILAILSAWAFVVKKNASKDPKKMAKFYAFEQKWRLWRHSLVEKGPFARLSTQVSESLTMKGPKPSISPTGPSPTLSLPGGPSPARAALPPLPVQGRPQMYRPVPPPASGARMPPPQSGNQH